MHVAFLALIGFFAGVGLASLIHALQESYKVFRRDPGEECDDGNTVDGCDARA